MEKQTIIIERSYPAPVAKIWQALTNLSEMKQWYFPKLTDFQPVVGFETAFTIEREGKKFIHVWKVCEVVAEKKIAYEWRYEGYPGNSVLSFELLPQDDKTHLVLTHDNLETFKGDIYPELAKANFEAGWTGFMDKGLKSFLEKQ